MLTYIFLELKLEMEEEEMSPYMNQFDDGVKDDLLMIGNIALEDVQAEERQLRDEHIQVWLSQVLDLKYQNYHIISFVIKYLR